MSPDEIRDIIREAGGRERLADSDILRILSATPRSGPDAEEFREMRRQMYQIAADRGLISPSSPLVREPREPEESGDLRIPRTPPEGE